MRVFEFVGSISRKICGSNKTKAEAAAKIRAEIESGDLGIRQLRVSYQDGNCLLAGDCPSAQAMVKAVLIAGNVYGVSQVDVANLKVPPQTAVEKRFDNYVIEHGDTLSKIAQRYYGDVTRSRAIVAANRGVIKDPNLIFPGQRIRVPLSPEPRVRCAH